MTNMRSFNILFSLFAFLFCLGYAASAQTNFNQELRNADPLRDSVSRSIEEKLKLHTDYLHQAIEDKKEPEQFYGYLFLFSENLAIHDYVEATKSLLKADSIANLSGNWSWLGAVHVRQAVLESKLDDDVDIEFNHYTKAAEYFSKAGDSLNLGICLEQLGNLYKSRDAFDSAHICYNRALPILSRHGSFKRRATAYNNYSILLIYEGKFDEALVYADSAFYLAHSNKDMYKAMLYLNNMGALYAELGQYDRATRIYKECVLKNKSYSYPRRMLQNFRSLYEVYELKNQYDSAFMYLQSFNLLKDSLTEADVKIKIAELEIRYDTQEKELALKNSQLSHIETKKELDNRNILVFLILGSVVLIVFFYRFHIKQKQKELYLNRERLSELTKILLEKNSLLKEYEEKLAFNSGLNNDHDSPDDFSEDSPGSDIMMYNQRILTDADWLAFKNQFDKAYPDYLIRLRKKYPTLTDAEERMFLLIKLKLNNKEAASILGIAPNSIKKTRNRLRKRLELPEDMNLDVCISEF